MPYSLCESQFVFDFAATGDWKHTDRHSITTIAFMFARGATNMMKSKLFDKQFAITIDNCNSCVIDEYFAIIARWQEAFKRRYCVLACIEAKAKTTDAILNDIQQTLNKFDCFKVQVLCVVSDTSSK